MIPIKHPQWNLKKLKGTFNLIKKINKIDTLTFITCGSVDNGKSTLLGRMLFDKKLINKDQEKEILNLTNKNFYKKYNLDYSLFLDGLIAEREQKITIDVSYKYFRTKKRKFIICDAPGHEQYTRNMVTGASKADLAILLIDAKKGILEQTLRHLHICHFLRINNILVIINKIDTVNYNLKIYNNIKNEFEQISKELHFSKIHYMPTSALLGENITRKSKKIAWYKGPSLLKYLENVKINKENINENFIMPIQLVQIDKGNKRRYLGKISSGNISVNQDIFILPSKQKNTIKKILFYKKNYKKMFFGNSISIELKKENDISRGDILTTNLSKFHISSDFESNLIWLDDSIGYIGRFYSVKIGNSIVGGKITKIKIINFKNDLFVESQKLKANNLAKVHIKLEKQIPICKFEECKDLGSFILIDRITNNTLAAGMISLPIYSTRHISYSENTITRKKRNTLNGHRSKVIWFTGLSGAGKTTLAKELEKKFFSKGIRTYILDGDKLRKSINSDLSFTETSRIENIRRAAEISKLLFDAGIVVMTAFISPFKAERLMARNLFKKNDFLEVYVKASIETVKKRDVKGLYKKAQQGKIKNFTGVDAPYEAPENPDLLVDTNKDSIKKTVGFLYNQIIETIIS